MTKKILFSLFAVASLGFTACAAEEDDTGATGGTTATTTASTTAGTTTGGGSTESGTTSGGGTTESTTSASGSATSEGSATSTGTTGTTDPTSGGTTEGCNFICEPDGGGADVQCDVWAQDCPDGQKCAPWANDGGSSWNATKCVDVTGTDNPGDQCMVIGSGVSGEDSCVEGAMCWNSDENGVGTCVGFCQGSPDAPSCAAFPATSCTIANDGVLILCLPGCDPLLQDCEGGDLCISTGADGFVCVLDASGDTGAVGDPCEFANACDPGNACINAASFPGCTGSLGCCSNFCNLQDGNTGCTEPGTECLPWYEMGTAPPQYTDVGICALPA